jgi:hypothetical protein
MSSEELITRLVAELPTSQKRWPVSRFLGAAIALGSAITFILIWFMFTRSPHLAHGVSTAIAFTVVAALTLAIGTYRASLTLSRPEAEANIAWPVLLAALILMTGVALELGSTPPHLWVSRLIGTHALGCFVSVTLLALPILFAALFAVRHGAPARPAQAGAAAGLLAGGITGALYQIHCPENSLLFVAVWHVAAIVALAGLGAYLGRRLLYW